MVELVWHWWQYAQAKREAGQGMVEYALILVLVALAAIAALQLLGGSVTTVFTSANQRLGGVTGS